MGRIKSDMKELQIRLDNIERIKEFAIQMTKIDCDMDLISGSKNHVVDAKSIMGIFSLDLSKPVTLKIYSDDPTIISRIVRITTELCIEDN